MSEPGGFSQETDDDRRVEQILTEQRRLQLRIGEQNRILRERQQKLMATLEQLQQREADATQMAFVAQEALSELRNAQERLVKTEKLAAIGHLAASMSHELRNPLGAIRNAWYYIEQKIISEQLHERDARIGKLSTIIDTEIDRCARIIGDLLDFARERPPFRTPTPLCDLVSGALAIVAKPAPTIDLINDVSEDLPVPFVDADQFRQVVVNLVQNAVEAVDRHSGRVRVSATEDDGWFTIEVEDNGPGVAPDVQARMFEPLFTTKTRGTGLGLSIVASIVQRHGGTINVESAPGQGAKFILGFPGGAATEGEAPAAGGAAELRRNP